MNKSITIIMRDNRAVPCRTVPYHTIQYSILLYSTLLHSTLLYSTLLCYAMLCYAMLCYNISLAHAHEGSSAARWPYRKKPEETTPRLATQ